MKSASRQSFPVLDSAFRSCYNNIALLKKFDALVEHNNKVLI